MATEITKYQAIWKPTRGNRKGRGRIRFRTSKNKTVKLNVADPAEFTAIVTLLSSSEKIGVAKGAVFTGAEDIDGD